METTTNTNNQMTDTPNQTKGHADNDDNKTTVLECGTSLAEQEYEEKLHETTTGYVTGGSPKEVRQYTSASPTSSYLSDLPRRSPVTTTATDTSSLLSLATDLVDLRDRLARNVITQHPSLTTFTSPMEDPSCTDANQHKFLHLPLVYADQTASNRPVQSIEDYLQRVCLPLYGNTHTNTSITGSQSTALVAEARQMVAEACNAKITGKASLDVVLFAGQGATSAVQLLIDGLGIRHATKPPIVFCGPYEHHSNLIPWREAGCRLVMIPECQDGTVVDLKELERKLKYHYESQDSKDCLKMGTFCAASNVTGKLTDTSAVAALLHRYGALAFFDYATAAPYVQMDMNPPHTDNVSGGGDDGVGNMAKDAIFFSPHKCLGGGAGTPGVLVCKKHLISQVNSPQRSGGGTVFYVTHRDHRFLSNRLERYEGGTPHVAGVWRTGLIMRLKKQVEMEYKRLSAATVPNNTPKTLLDYECQTYQTVAAYWKEHTPNLVLLGHDETPHLPIFSFLIRCGERFLHYNYVCAILNDVFGIQSRGGCQCAGPYSQRLLGLTTIVDNEEVPNEFNRRLENALVRYKERAELLRAGYTRLSLPFKGLRQAEVEYVKRAVAWVANHGWALMCQYRCNHRTGEWRHSNRQGKPLGREERRWLSHYLSPADPISPSSSDPLDIQTFLDQTMTNADRLLTKAKTDQKNIKQTLKMTNAAAVLDDMEDLRWYIYPQECAHWLASETYPDSNVQLVGPLNPSRTTISLLPTDQTTKEDMELLHRKRKTSESLAVSSGVNTNESTEKSILSDGLVEFRDGAVVGSARLGEIDEKIRAGDLSDSCEILNKDTGKWVQLRAILGTGKKARTSATKDVEMETEGSAAGKAAIKKKEARDSSTWGIGSVTAGGTVTQPPQQPTPAAIPDKPTNGKKAKTKHQRPPPKMMRLVNQAIFNWDMIENGDRLLLGLSGGKDSLSLLHCLLEFRRKMPIQFELELCTIDPMTPSFDPSPLIPYVESLGLKYHYIKDNIVARANTAGKDGKIVSSLCAFCARMKRGNLYSVARKNNCNKLVLAQHLDDCAESFMMSVMHNGFLRTMKAHYTINEGDLAVIRPMVYCRESLMADFTKSAGLPVINENCPACFEEPKERARVKKLLSREELNYPNFYDNIRRSLLPLMHGDLEPILHGYTNDVVSKVRKRLVPMSQKGNKLNDDNAEEKKESDTNDLEAVSTPPGRLLAEASDEDLIRELARRKADRHRLAGAAKSLDAAAEAANDSAKAAKTVCTIDGACSFFD